MRDGPRRDFFPFLPTSPLLNLGLIFPGDSSGCGINEEIIEWMDKIQNSGDLDLPTPITSKKDTKPKVEPWNGDQETPGHKYTREANEPSHRRARRATRPKEDNKNTCSLFIQTDPLIWRHISEQVRTMSPFFLVSTESRSSCLTEQRKLKVKRRTFPVASRRRKNERGNTLFDRPSRHSRELHLQGHQIRR